jgi:hypothetical protein
MMGGWLLPRCVLPSGRGEQACFLWEGNDLGQDRVMTYKQVLEEVCQLVSHTKVIWGLCGGRLIGLCVASEGESTMRCGDLEGWGGGCSVCGLDGRESCRAANTVGQQEAGLRWRGGSLGCVHVSIPHIHIIHFWHPQNEVFPAP